MVMVTVVLKRPAVADREAVVFPATESGGV
jgi:hypothetical protein